MVQQPYAIRRRLVGPKIVRRPDDSVAGQICLVPKVTVRRVGKPLVQARPIRRAINKFLSKQVLVQRKAEENDSLAIRSQLDLAGKTLNVVKGSPSILRIRNLSNEIGDTIYVNEVAKYGSEQLIAMVAHGDIDYAVCDEGIARMAVDSLPQLDINTAISFTQFYSWGVSKQSPALLDSLNTWLSDFRKKGEYQSVYRKYYGKQ